MLAVVTGASRGLGMQCARELASHGADFALVARNQAALANVAVEIKVKDPGREVITLSCDLCDSDAPLRVREAADQLGQLDILVNNAAVRGLIGPAWECRGASSKRRSASTSRTGRSVSCAHSEHERNRPRDHQYCRRRSNHAATNVRGLRVGKGRSRTLH